MPVKIFFCYAHEDELLLNKLKSHLRPLQRQGLIDVWHDRDISAGTEWESEISQHLNSAQIILLLISPDFMDSDYCYGIEMQRAMERHERGETRVIPVILRPVYWQVASLPKLQALPTDAKPVRSWLDQDEAFFNVVSGIFKVLEELSFPQRQPSAWSASASQEASPWGQQDPNQLQQAEQAYKEIQPRLSVSPSVAPPPSQPSQPVIPEILPPSQRLTVHGSLPIDNPVESPMTGERRDAVGARFITPVEWGGTNAQAGTSDSPALLPIPANPHDEGTPALEPTASLADTGVTSIPTWLPGPSNQPDKTASRFGWPDQPHKTTPLPAILPGQWQPRRVRRQRRSPLIPIILFPVAAVLLTMSGVFAFQLLALPTASIHFSAQTHLVSLVFQLTTNPSATSIDLASWSIPARVLRESKAASQTGQTGQPTVSEFDVYRLAAQIRPSFESQIAADLQKRLQTLGATALSSVQFSNNTPTSNPQVGSPGTAVTVTLTEQGSVDYFLNSDAQTVARQLLLKQMQAFGANYVPVDSTIRIGQPVVVLPSHGEGNGVIATVEVATAGYVEYQFSQSQLSSIQSQIKGMTVNSVRSFIVHQAGVDPIMAVFISFRVAGSDRPPAESETLPGDPQRIMLIPTYLVTFPTVQLPQVPPSATPSQK